MFILGLGGVSGGGGVNIYTKKKLLSFIDPTVGMKIVLVRIASV